jgi:hypothetical protein
MVGYHAPAMLTCLPLGLCSWNYRILGTTQGQAVITFTAMGEQGGIDLGGRRYSIGKQGWLSGRWDLEGGGQVLGTAAKLSPFFRSFAIHAGDVHLSLQAQALVARPFDLRVDGKNVGSIWPAHAFTRRAFIDCDPSVPELIQLFAFWLAALTWRRAARNS